MRYLSIDYGSKRTGLAICDATETIVSPLTIIEGQKKILEKIATIVTNESVKAIVLGLPLNMNGSKSAQTKLVLKFAERLKQHLALPIHLQDERLSSFAAEEKLSPAEPRYIGVKTRPGKAPGRSRKRKKHLDAIAAAEILNAFFEQKNT